MFGGLALQRGQLFATHGVGRGRVTAFEPSSLAVRFQFAVAGRRRQAFTPSGLAVGPTLSLHVCDPGGGAIHEYSVFGKRVATVGAEPVKVEKRPANSSSPIDASNLFPRPDRRGILAEPRAIGLDERNNLYIASGGGPRVHAVQKFTVDGRFLGSFRAFGCPGETFNGPLGLVVSAQHVYVADSGNGAVHVFQRGGVFRQVFSTAPGHGERSVPVSLALDGSHGLLVLDRGSRQDLWRFTRSGEFAGSALPGASIEDPVSVAASEGGAFHVLDRDGARLRSFTRTGRLTAERDLASLATAPVKYDAVISDFASPSESELAT